MAATAKVKFNFRIKPETLEALRLIAEKEGEDVSEMARIAVEEFIRKFNRREETRRYEPRSLTVDWDAYNASQKAHREKQEDNRKPENP